MENVDFDRNEFDFLRVYYPAMVLTQKTQLVCSWV